MNNNHQINTTSKTRIKLIERACFFQTVRQFFVERQVVEVDTALLRSFTVTDPYMNAFSVFSPSGKHQGYLQTSPEYAMKQLICDGAGDVFQLSKMFRAEESGKFHSNEFTMLEWYRMGFNHFQLMDEVCELIQNLVGQRQISQLTYREVFLQYLSFDPFSIDGDSLKNISEKKLGQLPNNMLFDNYLTLLFSEVIEPQFDENKITIVYGYPESQASLAKLSGSDGRVTADRFEVYLGGMELANGFNELTDPDVQYQRFVQDNITRQELGYPEIEIDTDFIQALKKGLPNCAGVALGFDRLLMIKTGQSDINSVL